MGARRWTAALAVAGVLFTSCASGQSLSPAQRAAVYQAYFRVIAGGDRNLHSYARDANGSRGYDIFLPTDWVVASHAPFARRADEQLHVGYCASGAIVLATAVSSRAYLAGGGSTIFTDTAFRVDEVLKGAPDTVHAGARIEVVRIGGAVTDAGETLRVGVEDRPDFQAGGSYLLLLDRPGPALSVWHATDWITVEAVGGRLRPSSTPAFGLQPGESVQDLRARLDWLASRYACP